MGILWAHTGARVYRVIICRALILCPQAESEELLAIVVRLYEAFGGQVNATLTCKLPIKAFQRLGFLHYLCMKLWGSVYTIGPV